MSSFGMQGGGGAAGYTILDSQFQFHAEVTYGHRNLPLLVFDGNRVLGRLAFAALVGGIIGFERRQAARPVGIRAMALVAIGAAAFTIVGIYGFSGDENPFRDPARVAAQVATGVGFIGAGTMIRSGGVVRGLTTAAGSGMYVIAFGGAVISTAILDGLPRRPDTLTDDEGSE